MKKHNVIVKCTGFSYLELIFSLFLICNLFVLVGQIFYNMASTTKIEEMRRIDEYEVVVLRIENDLKQAQNINVQPYMLTYTFKDNLYKYYCFNHNIALQMNNTQTTYYLNRIRSIEFLNDAYFLYIKITDINGFIYESRVFLL